MNNQPTLEEVEKQLKQKEKLHCPLGFCMCPACKNLRIAKIMLTVAKRNQDLHTL